VVGATETGQLVFLGPIREALTGQFYVTETPLSYAANRQIYRTSDPVQLPNPVLVYSVDDITGQFDGTKYTFDLTRGEFPIPPSQISTYGVFVFLGGVVQKPGSAYTLQTTATGSPVPRITFSEAPPPGTSCDIRIVTSDDENESMEVVNFSVSPEFNNVLSVFNVGPSMPSLTNLNSFVFLSGVEQNPSGLTQTSAAYTIDYSDGASVLTFIGGAPQVGTTFEMRGIVSGEKYRRANLSTVYVVSTDDIAPLFNTTRTTFPLLINGQPADPTKVNRENIFVSLGGVMQIPIAQSGNAALAGNAYSVQVNPVTKVLEITFAVAPLDNTTCNIRIITSDEFLTCPLPPELLDTALQDGPGITVNEFNQIVDIDSGLIN
jgi:hypothetical protein